MTQTTLKVRVSIIYDVEGEHPEMSESAHTWHKLPDQKDVRNQALALIDNFYDRITS